MVDLGQLTRILGGRSVLGRSLRTEDDVIDLARTGVPYASLEALARDLDLTVEETARSLHLARRTVSRRKSSGDRMRPEESERLLRLGRIAVRAQAVLGSAEKAQRWLARPNRALGGRTPLSLLDVDLGAQRVDQVLTRIQYGVIG